MTHENFHKYNEQDQRRAEERRYQRAIEGWLAGRIRTRARRWRAEVAAASQATK